VSQNPTIGRAVHYQSYGSPGGEHKSEPRAATITSIHADGTTVSLFVMTPTGTFHNATTPYSETPKAGHWSWPPRVP